MSIRKNKNKIEPIGYPPDFPGKNKWEEVEEYLKSENNIVEIYKTQKKKLEQQAADITEGINRSDFLDLEPEDSFLTKETLEDMVHNFSAKFDKLEGGTKGAPKFPMPNNVLFLLRYYARTKKPEILDHVELTLQKMAAGGIYDQIGGGFARYSVDAEWHVPHFEKMLYDNAQLVSLYAKAFQLTGNKEYKNVVEETLTFIEREMTSPEGAFYSALDADSEGEEGVFYVWTPNQVKALLDKDEYRHLARYYGLDRPANFEGRWHLHNFASVAELNQTLDSSAEQARSLLESARGKLFQAREQRIRPGRDEKILTAWNALMIKGMARAGRVLGRDDFIRSAERSLAFIRDRLWHDGRLLATAGFRQREHELHEAQRPLGPEVIVVDPEPPAVVPHRDKGVVGLLRRGVDVDHRIESEILYRLGVI